MFNVLVVTSISPFVRLALQLVLGYVLAPEEFSEFVIVWTASLFIISCLTASSLNYFYHFRDENIGVLPQVKTATVMVVLLAAICSASIDYFYDDVTIEAFCVFAFLVMNPMIELFRKISIKRAKYRRVLFSELTYTLALSALCVTAFIFLNEYRLEAVLLSFCFASFFYFFVLKFSFGTNRSGMNWFWFRFGIPLVAASVLQFFSGHYFILVAHKYVSFGAVGELSLLRNVFSPLILILGVIDIDKSDKYTSQKHEKGQKKLSAEAIRITLKVAPLLVGLSAVAYLSSNFFEFRSIRAEFSFVFIVFCVSHLMIIYNRASSMLLRANNLNVLLAIGSGISFCFTALLTDLAGSYFGLNGLLYIMLAQQIIFVTISVSGLLWVDRRR